MRANLKTSSSSSMSKVINRVREEETIIKFQVALALCSKASVYFRRSKYLSRVFQMMMMLSRQTNTNCRFLLINVTLIICSSITGAFFESSDIYTIRFKSWREVSAVISQFLSSISICKYPLFAFSLVKGWFTGGIDTFIQGWSFGRKISESELVKAPVADGETKVHVFL